MTNFSKNQVTFYTATEKDDGQRLDNLLNKVFKKIPKSHIYRIIRSGEIRINKKRAKPQDKVNLGDEIRIPPIDIPKANAPELVQKPKLETFPILFEDEYYMVIDKPSGIACHGGSGISFGVIETLRLSYPDAKFLELVHRLDKNTSGVLILAKKRQALVKIQELIRNNQIQKYYLALTIGKWKDTVRNIKLPLLKYALKDGGHMVKVDKEKGSFAHTVFNVVEEFDDYTLVKADIKTGKTHQIRVHLLTIGHPIIGDDKYGNFDLNKQVAKNGLKRMFLHAQQISFIHPITQKKLVIEAPIPTELEKYLNKLR